MFRFKWTLTKRIWLSFAFLILMIGAIMAIFYPFYIQSILRKEAFDTIIAEQAKFILHQDPGSYGIDNPGSGFLDWRTKKSIGSLLVDSDFNPFLSNKIPGSVIQEMKNQSAHQGGEIGRYEMKYGGRTLYYVVRKIQINTDTGYLISYMWDTYTKELMHELWSRLIFIFLMAGVISLFIAFLLARYLKRPLDILGRRFEEISRLNWEKPFEWKGDEEFERLSSQFEKMRLNLMKYDESQKVFLQQASHELKTPVMVVQSYAQSVKDGIYPKGGLDDSMDVIIKEARQMERRVKKLLYFTRVDSLRRQNADRSWIAFGRIGHLIRDRLMTQRPDVAIHVADEETAIRANREQLETILENLVENALRYAKKNIWMSVEKSENETKVIVRNDGEPIQKQIAEDLFEPFQKGEKGQFGLGLAIVKRIVDDHGGRIDVRNQAGDVAFIITLPSQKKDDVPPADKA
ncbi:HAMP domain-containing histidine kinase [Sporolactobacillus sp. THM7-7]|nr:HAMP domain-containing histidine kinase [Sporolactobacillus sp. THM7-7]